MGTGASKSNEDFCMICSSKFNPITKRKRQCIECTYNYCTDCLVPLPASNGDDGATSGTPTRGPFRVLKPTTGNCKHCLILLSGDPTYQSLNELNVRRLKEFLRRRNVVDLSKCTEKKDLVELILERFGGETHRQTIRERQSRTEDLLARNRVSPDSETPPPPTSEQAPTEPEAYAEDIEDRSSADTEPEIKQDNETISKISLSEIESESEIESLNAKQLKIILTRNLVEYKGCKEKHELITRVKMLWESRQANQRLYEKLLNPQVPADGAPPNPDEKELCKICMDSAIDCVLLDCGHMVTCTKCGKQMNECPICRQYVVRAVHIFRA